MNVLNEVVNTTLSMFAEDYIYDETTVETDVNGLIFHTKGTVKKKHWLEIIIQRQDRNK